MDDSISRRDAIDIVRCYYRKGIDRYCQKIETVDGTCYYRSEVMPYVEAYKAISTALKGLPSAQLEIIRCKDCKYGGMKENEEGYCAAGAIDQEITGMDYCSWAEGSEI